ncbi:repressor [Xenorhabdus khoisanae]|uniref:Repressor n=1 Tax=Xenorhabdus khoisanae TaxID=880157 RepID=A0A0J5FQ16_9GAMM|nr:repressor [Xenorhabdus khoisanae]
MNTHHEDNSLRNRLKTILTNEDIKQKELAERLTVSAQTVNNWLNRNAISREAAQKISDIYGYSLDWLLNGVGETKRNDISKPWTQSETPPENEWGTVSAWDSAPLDDNEVEVPFLPDIEFVYSDGSLANIDRNGFKLKFAKSALRRMGVSVDGSTILCFPAKGDSMGPVIPDGATVAIDTANKNIIDGKVYAIEQDGLKRIKCLYRKPGGKLLIRSYNRDEYEDEMTDQDSVNVIGKLFWYAVVLD